MIESLVGAPYQGDFGCFTVVRRALELLGHTIPDYTLGLTECARLAELQARLAQHAAEVAEPRRGDVVLLQVCGEPGHIGIMINSREMLHCMEGTATCIERLSSPRWRGRIVGYWRI